MKWVVLLIAGVLAACQNAVVSSSESGITLQHTGTPLGLAATVADAHCKKFGRHAVLTLVDDVEHTAQFRCAEGVTESSTQPETD